MQLRCYRCGWSFAIKKEELAFALEALQESQGNHYDVRCPRCRHMNRVSLEQLLKFAPKVEAAEAEAGAESEPEATAAEAEAGAESEPEATAADDEDESDNETTPAEAEDPD